MALLHKWSLLLPLWMGPCSINWTSRQWHSERHVLLLSQLLCSQWKRFWCAGLVWNGHRWWWAAVRAPHRLRRRLSDTQADLWWWGDTLLASDQSNRTPLISCHSSFLSDSVAQKIIKWGLLRCKQTVLWWYPGHVFQWQLGFSCGIGCDAVCLVGLWTNCNFPAWRSRHVRSRPPRMGARVWWQLSRLFSLCAAWPWTEGSFLSQGRCAGLEWSPLPRVSQPGWKLPRIDKFIQWD